MRNIIFYFLNLFLFPPIKQTFPFDKTLNWKPYLHYNGLQSSWTCPKHELVYKITCIQCIKHTYICYDDEFFVLYVL